jgi:hypothetical protein
MILSSTLVHEGWHSCSESTKEADAYERELDYLRKVSDHSAPWMHDAIVTFIATWPVPEHQNLVDKYFPNDGIVLSEGDT